jgi:signal transduction histidine kinase
MFSTQAFRARIKLGFALVIVLATLISIVSLHAIRTVINTKDHVISEYTQDMVETRELELAAEKVSSCSRAYLLTNDPLFLERANQAREVFYSRLETVRGDAEQPEEQGLVQAALDAATAHQKSIDEVIAAERKQIDPKELARLFESIIGPRSAALHSALDALTQEKDAVVAQAIRESRRSARKATLLVGALGGTAAILAAGLFLISTRTLLRLERSEMEVRSLNEGLERRVIERTREIESFAYSIAHELRSPLRAMAGWSEIVLTDNKPRLDEPSQNSLRRIRLATLRMDDLISGLLGLARLSYESFPLSSVDVSDAFSRALSAMGAEIRARGARIDVQATPLRVLANPWLLEMSLSHLISNGLKFVAPGVVPQIHLWAGPWGDRVRVQVADNGIGIPPEYHARVFGMFERLHSAEDYPGVGVGLALAQRAVNRMGGSIGVTSTPVKGSVFWIELPTEPAPARRRETRLQREQGRAALGK